MSVGRVVDTAKPKNFFFFLNITGFRTTTFIQIIIVSATTYLFAEPVTYLNRTLVIDLPFKTLAVGLLVEFID